MMKAHQVEKPAATSAGDDGLGAEPVPFAPGLQPVWEHRAGKLTHQLGRAVAPPSRRPQATNRAAALSLGGFPYPAAVDAARAPEEGPSQPP